MVDRRRKVAIKETRQSPSAHVETIRRNYRGKIYEQHLVRRTYREGGKVKHQTLANLTKLPDHLIDLVRRSLRGETLHSVEEAFEVRRSLPHGHVAAVLGTVRRLGLERLLAPAPSRWMALVLVLVVARVLKPASKLATARGLRQETRCTSLGEVLGVGEVDEEELYRVLDWLGAQQARIEHKLSKRHLGEGCLVLYDLTSVAYTGSHCPLADFGFPPEGNGRRRYRQVRLGLVCTRDGVPVAVEVFAGNTSDGTTVRNQVEKLRKRYQVGRVVLVGDRGVLADTRIREGLAAEGLDWITALRAPSIRALVEAGALQLSLFDQKDLAEISSPEYPGERLIACRNPLLAEERAQKREDLLRATEKKLDEIVAATRRACRPLRGEAAIALRVGRVVDKYRMAKHLRLRITDNHFSYERDNEHIRAEAALDGLYVIRTTVPVEELSAEETVRAYKDLSAVEHAFRCLKSVDLKVRPVFHRLEKRVRAHAFLCMLAYYVEWHMRRALAPMLFDEEDRAAAEAQRRSVVAPAQRSPQAQRKAQTKRTAQGEPVHSFQTLLEDLGTIAKNDIVFKTDRLDGAEEPVVQRVTTPTSLQKRAFDLLGVALK